MPDQAVALMTGSQQFPDTTGSVQLSFVDLPATEEKGKMVLRGAIKMLTNEAEWGPEFNSMNIGSREMTMINREETIVAAADGDSHNGLWNYRLGGAANNSILNISLRFLDNIGTVQHQDTLVLLSEHAPMIQVVTNFPHEPLAVTNTYQVFKGRAWPLPITALKDMFLKPKPAYALRYMDLTESTENDLVYLDFDDNLYSWEDMVPQVEVHKSERTDRTQIMPKANRPRRQVRTVRKRRG